MPEFLEIINYLELVDPPLLKKYWREVVKPDMEQSQLTEGMTLDR